MPPWLPQAGYGEFHGERRSTEQEIRTTADWVQAGAPEGPAPDIPAPPSFPSGWQLGEPDLIIQAKHAFSLPAAGPNVFWNFVLDPGVKTTRYVRAIPAGCAGRGGYAGGRDSPRRQPPRSARHARVGAAKPWSRAGRD